MKKLVQISLVVLLVVMAFQASTGSAVALSVQTGSAMSTSVSGMANTSLGDHVAAVVCPTGIRFCAVPSVGWNS